MDERATDTKTRRYLPDLLSLIVFAIVLLTMLWLNCRETSRSTPYGIWKPSMIYLNPPGLIGSGRGWPATYLIHGEGGIFAPNLWIDAAIAIAIALVCACTCEIWLRGRPNVTVGFRKARRIRLVTLFVGVITIGAILWINFRPKIENEKQTVMLGPGWPEPFLHIDFRGKDAKEVQQTYYAWSAGFRNFEFGLFDFDALAYDFVIGLAILFSIGFLCEFVARRTDRKRRN